MFIFMWKTTCLHLQLWAKFHSGQLLMRLMVGLMPVRLGLLHRTGEGKQSQSFKMTVILMWMPWHPRLIPVYLPFKICHPVSRATFFILPQIELIFRAKVSFSFSPAPQGYCQCPVLLFWYSGSSTATAPSLFPSLTVLQTWTFHLSPR